MDHARAKFSFSMPFPYVAASCPVTSSHQHAVTVPLSAHIFVHWGCINEESIHRVGSMGRPEQTCHDLGMARPTHQEMTAVEMTVCYSQFPGEGGTFCHRGPPGVGGHQGRAGGRGVRETTGIGYPWERQSPQGQQDPKVSQHRSTEKSEHRSANKEEGASAAGGNTDGPGGDRTG